MVQDVKAYIREQRLFQTGAHLLVAVSGGADSVSLLTVLAALAPEMDLTLTVAHLDHRTRGEASTADAAFVEALADSLGCAFAGMRVDVPARARRRGVSLEMAARDERYAFFARAARECGSAAVATAHTADDQAETVLLKLMRGAGCAGLSAMSPATLLQGVRVVRPLLAVTRKQVETYLMTRGVSWREDATNCDGAFLRNRVRHELLPLVTSRFNPGAVAALNRTAEVLRQEDAWMETLVVELLAACRVPGGLDVDLLQAFPCAARRRVVRRWLVEAGVAPEALDFDTAVRVERLLAATRGTGSVCGPGGWMVRREYSRVCLEPSGETDAAQVFRAPLVVPGETLIPEANVCVQSVVAPGLVKDRPGRPGRLPGHASLRKTVVGRKRVYVRSWQSGDRMRPLGLQGSKKLQDIFVDAKVPVQQRSRVPVFECGGEIVWIPGYRVARGWEVTDPAQSALQLTVLHL